MTTRSALQNREQVTYGGGFTQNDTVEAQWLNNTATNTNTRIEATSMNDSATSINQFSVKSLNNKWMKKFFTKSKKIQITK